jgi:hypothetical protein
LPVITAVRYGALSQDDIMRPAFTKFDPRALLDDERRQASCAKAANSAKDSSGQAPAVASLATLAMDQGASVNQAAFINDGGELGGRQDLERCGRRPSHQGVVEWLNQHPAPSAPGRCAWCGRPESLGAVVLPFGTEPGTHAWLHADCWPVWYEGRRNDAIAALCAMGIRA